MFSMKHHQVGSDYLLSVLCGMLGMAFSLQAESFQEAKAQHWHQWRGPEANGVSRTASPPLEWSETRNIQWKRTIEGRGTSTPIIWGDRVFVLSAVNTGKVDPALPRTEDDETLSNAAIKREVLHLSTRMDLPVIGKVESGLTSGNLPPCGRLKTALPGIRLVGLLTIDQGP